MLTAWPSLRRLVASLALAVLAAFAVLGSAHAGLHARGTPHGAAQRVAQPLTHAVAVHADAAHAGHHGAGLGADASAERGDAASPDASDCPCCPGTVSGLAWSPAHGLDVPRPDAARPRLADRDRPGTPPEGLRRPPRHP